MHLHTTVALLAFGVVNDCSHCGNTRRGVSWHHSDIPNMLNGYLVNGAVKSWASCTKDAHIAKDVDSGNSTEVRLNSVCILQCLSIATAFTCIRL
jgi:hypothetical protein